MPADPQILPTQNQSKSATALVVGASDDDVPIELVDRAECMRICGIRSRATLDRHRKNDPLFPKAITEMSPGKIYFVRSELQEYLREKIRRRDSGEAAKMAPRARKTVSNPAYTLPRARIGKGKKG